MVVSCLDIFGHPVILEGIAEGNSTIHQAFLIHGEYLRSIAGIHIAMCSVYSTGNLKYYSKSTLQTESRIITT